MRALLSMLVGALLLAACRETTPPEPRPAPDAAAREDAVSKDAPPDLPRTPDASSADAVGDAGDVLAPPIWTDPTWRLSDQPIPTPTREPCGDLTFVTPWWPSNSLGLCQFDGNLFIEESGLTVRVDRSSLEDAIALSSARTVPLAGRLRSAPHALYASVVDRDWRTALLRFEARSGPAEVVVNGFGGRPFDPVRGGGFYEFAVTDSFIAWIFTGEDPSPALYVAGPHGEGRRLIPADLPYHLHAQGDRLVWADGGDIWLYTASTGAVENLTHDAAAQWNPWVHGDLVVWLDQRDTPGPYSHRTPNNPEVYAMNLRDRVPQRITHDPPTRPVYQRDVSTDGRWIIYRDYRNNARPNEDAEDGVSEVYGVRVGTNVEVPLLTGLHTISAPTILGDELYVACGRAGRITRPEEDLGLFRRPLPP